ncbi:MAG: ABC transporter ATP-binding protein, partial [Actinomycetota bacterium]|nr:ABC transporter ATP-binding protein [Actinomycetota bacterium]
GKIVLPFGETPIPDQLRGRLQSDGKQREVIVGVRPEHFEDSDVEPDRPGLKFTAPVSVVESMGSELYAYFAVETEGVASQELEELAQDAGTAEVPGADSGQVVARLDAASRVSEGAEAELWFDAAKLHLFDAESGRSLRTA